MKQPAPNDPFLLDVDDPGHPLHIAPWKLERTPNGFTLATEGDSDKEHAKAVEVLRVLMGDQALPVPSAPVDAPVLANWNRRCWCLSQLPHCVPGGWFDV